MKQIFSFKILWYRFSIEYVNLNQYNRYNELSQRIGKMKEGKEFDEALGEIIKIGNEWNL
jgi:hypothetical protein